MIAKTMVRLHAWHQNLFSRTRVKYNFMQITTWGCTYRHTMKALMIFMRLLYLFISFYFIYFSANLCVCFSTLMFISYFFVHVLFFVFCWGFFCCFFFCCCFLFFFFFFLFFFFVCLFFVFVFFFLFIYLFIYFDLTHVTKS